MQQDVDEFFNTDATYYGGTHGKKWSSAVRTDPLHYSDRGSTVSYGYFDYAASVFWFLCLLLVVAGCVMGVAKVLRLVRWIRWTDVGFWFTNFIYYRKLTLPYNVAQVRMNFRDTLLAKVRAPKLHSHGTLAGCRDVARNFMQDFCMRSGLTQYSYQASASDQRSGVKGFRDYQWNKDTTLAPQFDHITSNDVITMVDVDYYVQMPEMLCEYVSPYLLYTFSPEEVVGSKMGCTHTWTHNNCIHSIVSGGAVYTHPLWNYATDSISVFGIQWTDWYNFTPVYAAYEVERRKADALHDLVLLVPYLHLTGWSALIAKCMARTHEQLARLTPVVGDWITALVVKDTAKFSVARVGTYQAACVDLPVLDSFIALYQAKNKHDLFLNDVCDKLNITEVQASVLLAYVMDKYPRSQAKIFPVEYAIRRYQAPKRQRHDDRGKQSLVSFMSPILPECYTADICKSSDLYMKKERLDDTREEGFLTTELMYYVREFVDLMVPVQLKLSPCTREEVYERQNSPSQRSILDRTNWHPVIKNVVRSFQKKEAYQEVKPPRNISTIDCTAKLEYSRYTYPFMRLLKKTNWYAFGTTPNVIAKRVAKLCQSSKLLVNCADASRMDGHVSACARYLEDMVMRRVFDTKYHDEMKRLMASQYNNRGVTTNGVKYDQGYSRASGSPETSPFNSILSKFIDYVARRQLEMPPHEAYFSPGLFGGDDSISADLPAGAVERAGKLVNQVMKSQIILRGSSGVNFLARYYTKLVWSGDPSSCCDLKRQLSKFHATVKMDVDPLDKLKEKCLSFYLSDRNTPVIGSIAAKAMCLMDVDVVANAESNPLGLRKYDTLHAQELQYPQENVEGIRVEVKRQLYGIDIEAYEEHIAGLSSPEQLLKLPLLKDRKNDALTINGSFGNEVAGPVPARRKRRVKKV